MRTANPTLNEKVFTAFGRTVGEQAMTIQGTVNKTAILLALVLLSAGWTWNLYTSTGNPAAVAPWLLGGAIGGLVVALVTTFKQTGGSLAGENFGQHPPVLAGERRAGAEQGEDGRGDVDQPARERQEGPLPPHAGA